MPNFNGYLLKAGNQIFPHEYMLVSSFQTTPNIREEIKAVRDDNTRNLTRVTASGHKTTISFTCKQGLMLSQVNEILKFFTDHETNHGQRKIQLTYWNNEDLQYKTSYFYRADIDFTIREIKPNTIIYESFDISLVEY